MSDFSPEANDVANSLAELLDEDRKKRFPATAELFEKLANLIENVGLAIDNEKDEIEDDRNFDYFNVLQVCDAAISTLKDKFPENKEV